MTLCPIDSSVVAAPGQPPLLFSVPSLGLLERTCDPFVISINSWAQLFAVVAATAWNGHVSVHSCGRCKPGTPCLVDTLPQWLCCVSLSPVFGLAPCFRGAESRNPFLWTACLQMAHPDRRETIQVREGAGSFPAPWVSAQPLVSNTRSV